VDLADPGEGGEEVRVQCSVPRAPQYLHLRRLQLELLEECVDDARSHAQLLTAKITRELTHTNHTKDKKKDTSDRLRNQGAVSLRFRGSFPSTFHTTLRANFPPGIEIRDRPVVPDHHFLGKDDHVLTVG
jgi:hypothetical protein